MDQKYRTILDRNRQILVSNIIPTEDFLDRILKEKVLPLGMVRDVKEGETREDKNSRLLNALHLRASHVYRKFRNVLLETGHCFLADLLWDDETNSYLSEAIFNKFPEIFDKIPPGTKKRFLQYLDSKVRVRSLQSSWANPSARRMDTLYARSEDIRQEAQLRTTIEDLEKKVRALEQDVRNKDGKIMYLTIETNSLEKQLQHTRQEHKHDLETQRNFNMANNNTVTRLRDRLVMFNGDIVLMNEMIRTALGHTKHNRDTDPDNVKVSSLKNNLGELLKKMKHLENTVAIDERKEIIYMLCQDGSCDDTDNILEVVRRSVEREGKQRVRFAKEIEKMLDSLKGKPTSGKSWRHSIVPDGIALDSRHVTNMLATVRVEAEHLNKKLVWKDSEITKLTSELEMLKRNGVMSLESTSQEPFLDRSWEGSFEMLEQSETNGDIPFSTDKYFQQLFHHNGDSVSNYRNSRPQQLKGQQLEKQLEKRNKQNTPLSKTKSLDYRSYSVMNVDNS